MNRHEEDFEGRAELERRLTALRPSAGGVSVERVMFETGRLTARRRLRCWQASTAVTGCVAIAMMGLQFGQSNQRIDAHAPVVVSTQDSPSPNPPAIADLRLPERQRPAAAPTIDSAALPDYVRRQLERLGYSVQEERQLMPIELENGAVGVIPIDRVKIQFVGHEVY